MTELVDVLTAVEQRVSYLRAVTSAPEGEGWIGCAPLVASPKQLRAAVDATAPGRGTDDPQIAASLFAQAYAFRVASVAVAAYALGLPSPSVAPSANAIRIGRSRPAELAILDPSLHETDEHELAAALLGAHLRPFVEAIRDTVRVGERLLWGNVAGSIATVFRALDGSVAGGDAAVRARAERFTVAASPWLGGLGTWSTLTVPPAVGWFWDRTSCCLWYRTSAGSYCDDCSLHDPEDLRAVRLADLAGSNP